jgi:hypothetical protein
MGKQPNIVGYHTVTFHLISLCIGDTLRPGIEVESPQLQWGRLTTGFAHVPSGGLTTAWREDLQRIARPELAQPK